MPKVYILCGKIASGKTTYANMLCEKEHAVVLSIDDVMLRLYEDCLGPQKHQEVMKNITSYFFTLIPQLFAQRCSAILDYGYWTKEERNWIKEQCILAKLPYELHYIEVDEELRFQHLHKRNQENARLHGRQYIIQEELQHTLDARFEIPTADEYDKKIQETLKF